MDSFGEAHGDGGDADAEGSCDPEVLLVGGVEEKQLGDADADEGADNGSEKSAAGLAERGLDDVVDQDRSGCLLLYII